MIVGDANIWIDFIKQPHIGTGAVVRDLLRDDRIALVGVVLAEILRGLRGEDRKTIEELLMHVPYIEMTRSTWARAGRLAMELDTKGTRIPMTDIFIAAATLEGNHELFTRDGGFERVEGLRLYDPKEVT